MVVDASAAATVAAAAEAAFRDDGVNNREQLEAILENLTKVEESLQAVVNEHRDGRYGYVTREWGFTAPGGLGGKLGDKFKPWEDKLEKVKTFFWPIEAYEAMDHRPFGLPDRSIFKDLSPKGEQLYGNTPLHEYLKEAPSPAVVIEETDIDNYRNAARIFLLIGTLSHLYGNSAQDRKTAVLPAWIEEPLIVVAKRLEIEPTLSGHFLVQENWMWKSQVNGEDQVKKSKASLKKKFDKIVLNTLLKECVCGDRRFRFKVYPNCFVGNQAVDVLMDYGYADSREEAVRLGRRINKLYHLFQHVTNDHSFMDEHLFYRFRKKWSVKKAKMTLDDNAESNKYTAENGDDDDDDDDDDENEEDDADEDDDDVFSSRLIKPSDLTFRRSADSTEVNNETRRSKEFTEDDIGEKEKVSRIRFRRTTNNHNAPNSPASEMNESTHSKNYFTEGPNSLKETMAIVAIMAAVPVKNRMYHLRTYKQCFIGSQLIDILIENECASNRKDALKVALDINKQFRLFEHVTGNHHLKDQYLFFRFTKEFETMMQNMNLPPPETAEEKPVVRFSLKNKKRNSTTSAAPLLDENLKRCDASSTHSVDSTDTYDHLLGIEEEEEFRFDNIIMLYPAFGNNHERVNQLIPACMGNSLSSLPFRVLDIISAMRNVLEAELNVNDDMSADSYEIRRLYDLLYKVAFSVSRCKEEFQQMSTDPTKRTFNSKYVSIKQTQPLSNGVLVREKLRKGTTGTQFPYFHLLDWLLGRFQFGEGTGLVAQIASVDNSYPRPQREYIESLSKLEKSSTLRGFVEALGKPKDLLTAYNHLVECYSGEGGVLQAHCRKLYSYIHNNVQSSTSGTNHLGQASGDNKGAGCPMSNAVDNHIFASMMFKHMRKAAEDRWKLRLPPLMTEVGKIIYSTSESGGFTTVALDISDSGLIYEYGDVVKVLLPNGDKTTLSWLHSLSSNTQQYFTLSDMRKLHKDAGNGWGWDELWEALGWCEYERDGGKGVPLEMISRYIEQGQISNDSNKLQWVNNPLDLSGKGAKKLFAFPPPIPLERIASLEPVSPRVYSVSGVEAERVFLLVSKPQDGARHHGYEGMSDKRIERVHCSFSPATFFLVPPRDVNLVCIASGTGISPFVGLVDSIGSRQGNYTIVHQCKSSDLFLANSQSWLDFTATNPGAVVLGYISGDRSRRNCPMRYVIRNGCFQETLVLRRHNACAYYFECELFRSTVQVTYKENRLNLAYCCGGVKSAIEPFENICKKEGMKFEFTCETYGVSPTLGKDSTVSQIGGTIVNMDHVSPIHPGGDQILHQLKDIVAETNGSTSMPDHSVAFYELHPHAYNLHRCLRTPLDADSEAFAAFLERQAMSKSVMSNMATKYAEAALSSPNNSKIVKIATELQSAVIEQSINSGDAAGAQQSAVYLEALLNHVPDEDDDADRWHKSLTCYNDSSHLEL